jgi:hypothetical protein
MVDYEQQQQQQLLLDCILSQLTKQFPEPVSPVCGSLSEKTDGLAQITKVLLNLGVVRRDVDHPKVKQFNLIFQ